MGRADRNGWALDIISIKQMEQATEVVYFPIEWKRAKGRGESEGSEVHRERERERERLVAGYDGAVSTS